MSEFKFGQRVRMDGRADEGRFVAYSSDRWANVLFDDGSLRQVYIADIVPEPPPEGTVPVRIAVAVDADGRTESRQIRDSDDENEIRQIVAEDLLDGQPGFCRVSVLHGDMPQPEKAAEVAGEVEVSDEDR